jgi:hypothetical protein
VFEIPELLRFAIILDSKFSDFGLRERVMKGGALALCSGNVERFVAKVMKGTPTMRNNTDLSLWTAMTTAYPWSSNIRGSA